MLPMPPKDPPSMRDTGPSDAAEAQAAAPPQRGARPWVGRVALFLFLPLLLTFGAMASFSPVVCWDRWDNVRVTGRLVDAQTGRPLEGLEVFTLPRAKYAEGERRMQQMRDLGKSEMEMIEAARAAGHDVSGYCPIYGWDVTDAEGQFDTCREVAYGGTDHGLWRGRSHTPPPHHGLEALLVTWPDGRRAVIDTTVGRYEVVDRDGIYAVIEMGTVAVRPEPPERAQEGVSGGR